MIGTRMTAILAAMVVAIGAGYYFYRHGSGDPAIIRANIASAGKHACTTDARDDPRNVLVPDSKLTGFCDCVLDDVVAGMSDADAREASVNTLVMSSTMRTKLASANHRCRTKMLD